MNLFIFAGCPIPGPAARPPRSEGADGSIARSGQHCDRHRRPNPAGAGLWRPPNDARPVVAPEGENQQGLDFFLLKKWKLIC